MSEQSKLKDAGKKAGKLAGKNGGPVRLVLVCDESGSMRGKEEAVVGGVNEFVESFRKKDATVTISMFDSAPGEPRVRVKVRDVPVKKAKSLGIEDYKPRGMTPLYDAIAETIGSLDADARDERAFVVILTDGLENASETSAETIRKLIKKREKAGWAFLYLGADHDVSAASSVIGLGAPGKGFTFASSRRGTGTALRSATGMAQHYMASASKADYDVLAASVAGKTGGVIDEDEALDADE